jgi:hypothetical protein
MTLEHDTTTTIIIHFENGSRKGSTISGRYDPVMIFKKHQSAVKIETATTHPEEQGSVELVFFRSQFKPEYVS